MHGKLIDGHFERSGIVVKWVCFLVNKTNACSSSKVVVNM